MKSLRCLAAVSLTAAALLLATAAQARERYFAFEPDTDEARFRSGDLTITVRQGLMGSTVERIYRERGADLGIKPPGKEFSERQALKAIGEGAFELQLYAVDPKEGAGFAHGACKGADRAWVALAPIRPYEPLRIYVLKYDEQAHAPELCETLDYHFRAEFLRTPNANSLAGPQ